MYFGLAGENSLNCWNTATEYGERNIDNVAQSPRTLQFSSGVKVITNRLGGQELWVLSSPFQKVMRGTLRVSDVNYRIQAGKIDDLIASTKCKAGLRSQEGYHHENHRGNKPGSGYGR